MGGFKLNTKSKISTNKQLENDGKDSIFKSKSELETKIKNDNNSKDIVTIERNKNIIAPNKNITKPMPVIKLRLNTLPNTQKSINRLIRALMNDEIQTRKARAVAHLIRLKFEGWRVQTSVLLDSRLNELEKLIKAKGNDDL